MKRFYKILIGIILLSVIVVSCEQPKPKQEQELVPTEIPLSFDEDGLIQNYFDKMAKNYLNNRYVVARTDSLFLGYRIGMSPKEVLNNSKNLRSKITLSHRKDTYGWNEDLRTGDWDYPIARHAVVRLVPEYIKYDGNKLSKIGFDFEIRYFSAHQGLDIEFEWVAKYLNEEFDFQYRHYPNQTSAPFYITSRFYFVNNLLVEMLGEPAYPEDHVLVIISDWTMRKEKLENPQSFNRSLVSRHKYNSSRLSKFEEYERILISELELKFDPTKESIFEYTNRF